MLIEAQQGRSDHVCSDQLQACQAISAQGKGLVYGKLRGVNCSVNGCQFTTKGCALSRRICIDTEYRQMSESYCNHNVAEQSSEVGVI